MSEGVIQWVSPGPTSDRFTACRDKVVRAFNGPVGCAKTTTLFQDNVFYIPMLQPRSPVDGIRRMKFTVVHIDYRKLWRGPIPTYLKLVPVQKNSWVGAKDGPAVHTVRFRHPVDRGEIRVIVEFVAIGDNDVEEFMRGYEPTRMALMEADLHSGETLHWARTRIGRYPTMRHGGPAYPGVDMDFNAPEFGSWLYDWMHDVPGDAVLFKAPPGMMRTGPGQYEINPAAENIVNLPAGYYQGMLETPEYIIRRMVLNQPGYNRHNLPVFEEFSLDVHVAAAALEPDPRLPLYIAFDQDLHPAGAIAQTSPEGQFRAIEEIIGEPGTGPSGFGDLVNNVLAQPRYQAFAPADIIAGCDPAGFWGGDVNSDKLSDREWVLKLARVTKLKIRPACKNNDLAARLDPLKVRMTQRLKDQSPKFIICPVKCPTIRDGLGQGYHYRRIKQATQHGIQWNFAPVKNEYSHPLDALQYVHLMAGGYDQFKDRDANRPRHREPSRAITAADGPAGSDSRPARRRGRVPGFARTQ